MSRLMRTMFMAILAGSLVIVTFAARAAEPTVRTIVLTNPGVRVAFAPDAKTVAVFTDSVSDTSMLSTAVDPARLPIELLDVASGKQVASLEGFTDYARAVAFTPEGDRLAAYHGNGLLDVWSLSGPDPRLLKEVETLEPFVSQVAFLPDGHTLVAQGTERPGRIRFWDTRTGAMTAVMGRHYDSLASLYSDMQRWPGFGNILYTTIAVSPDGKILATATAIDEVQLWAIPGLQSETIRPRSEQPPTGFAIRQLAFTGDGRLLVYFDGSDDHTHVWDVLAHSETVSLPFGGYPFALSADGKRLAWTTAVGDTTAVSVASLAGDGEPAVVATLPYKPSPLSALAFTPSGGELVVGGFAPQADGTNAIAIITLE